MHAQHTHSCLQSIVAMKVCSVKDTINCMYKDTSVCLLLWLQTQLLKSDVSIATKHFYMDRHLSTSTSKSCLSVTAEHRYCSSSACQKLKRIASISPTYKYKHYVWGSISSDFFNPSLKAKKWRPFCYIIHCNKNKNKSTLFHIKVGINWSTNRLASNTIGQWTVYNYFRNFFCTFHVEASSCGTCDG